MKKSIFSAVIASVVLTPLMAFAQVADAPVPTLTSYEAPTLTVAQPTITAETADGSAIKVDVISEPIVSPLITIIAEKAVEISNPALDVAYCGGKFVYTAGTYDQNDKPVKNPVCTAYDVKGISEIAVDFNKASTLPKHHFNVNSDGKISFSEPVAFSELMNKFIAGETDSQLYAVDGGEGFTYLRPTNEVTAQSVIGQNFQDKVIYFDDSIVYSYKIVK